MKMLVRILSAVAIGNSMLIYVIPIVYEQRGYQAYGGEYILAMFVGVLVYWIVGKV